MMKIVPALLALALAAAPPLNTKASLLDIGKRQVELRGSKDPRIAEAVRSLHSCVTMPEVPSPHGRIVIPAHYLSGSHGPTNPAEAEATRPYNAFEARVVSGMNRWLATGDEKEAACAQGQIDVWARGGALLDYDPTQGTQPWFQVGWTLSSVSISESVLMNARGLDIAMQARDIAWMNKAAHVLVDWDRKQHQTNNLHDWRGLAVTATGVISGDQELFQWGTSVYKEAIDQIDARGAFPQEMKRHERSVHYQAFALEPLVPLAMLAEQQGTPLFSYRSPSGRSISDAVDFLGAAIADPNVVKVYTDDVQTDFNSGDAVAFAEYYARHFGNAKLPASIQRMLVKPVHSNRTGGNLTVVAAPTP